MKYYIDIPNPENERYLSKALDEISNNGNKPDSVPTNMIFDILETSENISFEVVEKYMKRKLAFFDKEIKENTEKTNQNMDQIEELDSEI